MLLSTASPAPGAGIGLGHVLLDPVGIVRAPAPRGRGNRGGVSWGCAFGGRVSPGSIRGCRGLRGVSRRGCLFRGGSRRRYGRRGRAGRGAPELGRVEEPEV